MIWDLHYCFFSKHFSVLLLMLSFCFWCLPIFFSPFSSHLQCQHFLKLSLVSLPTASLFYSNSLLLHFICLLVDYIILLWLLCESMIVMRDLKFLEGKNSVLFFSVFLLLRQISLFCFYFLSVVLKILFERERKRRSQWERAHNSQYSGP